MARASFRVVPPWASSPTGSFYLTTMGPILASPEHATRALVPGTFGSFTDTRIDSSVTSFITRWGS